MSRAKDLAGQKFGRLTAKEPGASVSTSGGRPVRTWDCVCDCGTQVTVRAASLLSNNTTSCGCVRTETVQARRSDSKWNHLRPTTQSGKRVASTEYKSWQNMLDRCRNPKNPDWPYYGGRNITVSEEWESFDRFMDDMGYKPIPEMTIDRKDTNLGYHKDNCRWASRQEQSRNRNYTIAFRGFKTWELAAQLAIPFGTVHSRLSRLRQSKINIAGLFLPRGKKRNLRRFI